MSNEVLEEAERDLIAQLDAHPRADKFLIARTCIDGLLQFVRTVKHNQEVIESMMILKADAQELIDYWSDRAARHQAEIDRLKISQSEVEQIECPNCDKGVVVNVIHACCGNVVNGACQGHCVVPEQYQHDCGFCGGSGIVIQALTPAPEVDEMIEGVCQELTRLYKTENKERKCYLNKTYSNYKFGAKFAIEHLQAQGYLNQSDKTLKRQNSDLQACNNRLLERARDAEDELKKSRREAG